jgi:ABC-type antimicrobial peptide transport system permease subunit
VITIGQWGDFQVTGVMKDHPKNSHFQFEVLGSYSTLNTLRLQPNHSSTEFRNNYVYFTIPERINKSTVESFLAKEANKVYPTIEGVKGGFHLQQLLDIAPGQELYNQIGPDWGYASLTIFGVLTLLILLPACFNYANISISRALKRAKEIGLRKTVGGQKHQIVFQFITETVIITLLSLILSFGIFSLVRQEFLDMLVSSAGLDLNPDGYTILFFIGFAILIGILAGAIPAVYFSRLNPIQALKNNASIKRRKLSFRKVLIVGQFALSLGFIMSVVIVLKQYRASLQYDLGFHKDGIIDVDLQGVDPNIIKNTFNAIAQVQSISFSSTVIGTGGVETVFIKRNAISDSLSSVQMFSDEYYIENLNLNILAGRNFRQGGSPNEIIVNEEFVDQVGIPNPRNAIGETFVLYDTLEVTIVGVLKDFHYANLSDKIAPFILRHNPNEFRYGNIKVSGNNLPEAMEKLEINWNRVGGEKKFQARLMDDELEESYTHYFAMIKICGFLGFLAISISCLGLLGMVVYTTESRTKEIGVRKVMGASSLQIASLLSHGYLYLMLTSATIAVPITYILFDQALLQTYHYRFQIGIAEVIISVAIMFLMGASTILSQTIKASNMNPVETLRNE